jgi:hypothetical protein
MSLFKKKKKKKKANFGIIVERGSIDNDRIGAAKKEHHFNFR